MFKKNTAVPGFFIGNFINATTGAVVVTGTPVEKRTLDGTVGDCTNAASYTSGDQGWKIDLAAGDLNADLVGLSFTLTDCLPICFTIKTVTGIPDANGNTAVVLANSASHGGAAAVITLATPIVANATQIEGSDATDQINAAVDVALNTAIPGSPTADSINERIAAMDGGVQLADNAITASKYDESTAFPTKSADTGATKIARTGGDGSTLLTDIGGQLISLASSISTIDGIVDSILVDSGTTLDAGIAAIKTVTDKVDSLIEVVP
jgi:hypothetical protein